MCSQIPEKADSVGFALWQRCTILYFVAKDNCLWKVTVRLLLP